ncbi:MBL fold metallo-hydrolase [Flavobacterium ardleyense]|uniref:MBL fold metallo-hydrolase n=1 Tax=Flavobacterium ardleyense TaxID=2038737 RepID=UPI00298D3D4C|nr:MBL fold metallo-hydrolase [Flavobacterium ardleyense]
MLKVQKIQSEIFNSNVYTITSSEQEEVFLIDCGGFEPVIDSLPKTVIVSGIFLTHYHYDHIYFIKNWIDRYPNVKFYGSQITLEGLSNPKRNLSFYHEDPIEVFGVDYQVITDAVSVKLYDYTSITAFLSEGHCEGSLSFLLDNYIFTGDALIPNIPIVTKLKTGDKEKAKDSVRKIKSLVNDDFTICPGHLETFKYKEVKWNLYLND